MLLGILLVAQVVGQYWHHLHIVLLGDLFEDVVLACARVRQVLEFHLGESAHLLQNIFNSLVVQLPDEFVVVGAVHVPVVEDVVTRRDWLRLIVLRLVVGQ